MVQEILSGLLWKLRLDVRPERLAVRVGHGFADSSFRPRQVPEITVVGPLDIDLETEREPSNWPVARVLRPGHVVGRPRTAQTPAGTVLLRIDGDTYCTLRLPAGADFGAPGGGPALCAQLQDQLSQAPPGFFRDEAGTPIVDTVRLAELANATCRWDAARGSVVFASGRRGPDATDGPSTVEVVGGSGAEPAGFQPPLHVQAGQRVHHTDVHAEAYALGFRVDLWASSQVQLASMTDLLLRHLPMRGTLRTRCALLTHDVAADSQSLTVLDEGEPTTPSSLLHLERGDGASSRVPLVPFELADPAMVIPDGVLDLSNGRHARFLVAPQDSVPDPLRPDNPVGEGLSVSLVVELDGDSDRSARVLQVGEDNAALLQVHLDRDQPNTLRIQAASRHDHSGQPVPLVTSVSVPHADVLGVHVCIDARRGHLTLSVQTPAGTTSATARAEPGVLPGHRDLAVTVGAASGSGQLRLGALHVVRGPLAPLDPRARTTTTPAHRFRVGDRVTLADASQPARFEVRRVTRVDGSTLHLDRPTEQAWPRGATVVHGRALFLHQRHVRRKDDLLNRLFRLSLTYQAEGVLETDLPHISGPVVLEPVVDIAQTRLEAPAS